MQGEIKPIVDKVNLNNAVLYPFWLAVWVTEPTREVYVKMTYDDLKIICDLIDKKKKEKK